MRGSIKIPTDNYKVVIQETGLTPDTLQAREKCDGLLNSQHISGGHRPHSQYNIEIIKWLIERQNEGLRINRVVELWRNFEKSGRDPLQAMPAHEQMQQAATAVVLSGTAFDKQRQPIVDWLNSNFSDS